MSAAEIMDEINRLPPHEREMMCLYVRERLEPGQLSARELGALTQKMFDAKDPVEKQRLEDEIVRGFYGNVPHA